ncbi:MAG: hypothetical protein GXY83_12305 [Rhodopirellula sp.]|nr:hypothetical protein [Rhodopirellula sp.]
MTEGMFDHDRLDVYRLAIKYTAESFAVAKTFSRHRAGWILSRVWF